MKIIVRFEHPFDGNGIFSSRLINGKYHDLSTSIIGQEINDRHKNMEPACYINGWDEDHFCAYSSIDQIHEWLTTKEIKFLISEGFKILLLTVKHCIEADDQVLYLKDDIVQSNDITEIFN